MTRLARVVTLLLLAGCSYRAEKALRTYNGALDPVRERISEIARYQPRILERQTPEKIRAYVDEEILARCRHILATLDGIDPKLQRLRATHQELVSIWRGYTNAYEEFVEDLTDRNIETKKRRMNILLGQLAGRTRDWLADLKAIHDEIDG